jgi:hypothetical protein
MKISVISLFRDSEKTIYDCLQRLEHLEESTEAIFEYSFYENDSLDNTKKILERWMQSRDGYLISETLGSPKFSSVTSHKRNELMCYYRNKSLNSIKPMDSDYTVVFDSDVGFDNNIINDYIPFLEEDVVMVTPNVLQNINCKMFDSSKRSYYDSYALIDNDMNNGMTWSSNPFYRADDREKWDKGLPVAVKSAFGGFVMIRSEAMNKSSWKTNGHCEHWGLCSDLLKFGKILIIPEIITTVEHDPTIIHSISEDNINKVINFQRQHLNDKYLSKQPT